MTLTQDIYYSSEFKKSYETNYSFNIPLDVNIDIKGDEKIKFKLIDFSIMNSMLNISTYHNNNKFKFNYLNTDYFITIPDGSYTATSLKDFINNYLISNNILAFSISYNKTTNKFFLTPSSGIVATNLYFYPLNCSSLFGFTQSSYELIYPNSYYSETFANMLPYTKLILTTDLVFDTNTQNNFIIKYNAYSGVGNILCWLSRDIPLFSTINYYNDNNLEIELSNKNIKNIHFTIINEYQEFIMDAPPSFIHFQLIIYDNTNWFKRFYKLLYDIFYSLLSLYFKK